MDDVFNNLQKAGKNDVDNLIKWMKDSNLIKSTKADESKVRGLFRDVEDNTNIQLEKFKDVLQTLAVEQKKNFDELAKQLAAEGPRFLNAAKIGFEAFREALKNPK